MTSGVLRSVGHCPLSQTRRRAEFTAFKARLVKGLLDSHADAGGKSLGQLKTLIAQNIKFEDAHVNSAEHIFTPEENQHPAPYFQHGLIFGQRSQRKALKLYLPTSLIQQT